MVNNFPLYLHACGSGVRLSDGPNIKLLILVGWGRSFFAVAWPTGVQLLVFFCSSVPVVLFDTPGISRCRSQHVSVESSSLFHQCIYLWFICFPWWSFVELENLHADRTTVCFELWQKPRARLGTCKTGLSPPPPIQYFNTDHSKAVLLLWFLTVTCSCFLLSVLKFYILVQLLC